MANMQNSLFDRWTALKQEQPRLRACDAAETLGVSEAELVACRCGGATHRLKGPWGDLIKRLPELGEVMVLTRNDHVVHEKTGRFDKVSVFGSMGLVLNHDIDLRLFLNRWHHGFAVAEEVASGYRQSLQFFDLDGTAVHKVYLTEASDRLAFDRLVDDFRHADQAPLQDVGEPLPVVPDRDDGAIDTALLRDRWEALQDVHDFHAMLNDLGVGRVQAMRLVGRDYACPVAQDSFRRIVEAVCERQIPIMVFAGSPGVVQIHTGPVHTLKQMGPWFNVLDPGFNLHLREDAIASAWVVRKPTADGMVSSLEIYDAENRQIAWLFGERKPGKPEREDWRALLAALTPVEVAA